MINLFLLIKFFGGNTMPVIIEGTNFDDIFDNIFDDIWIGSLFGENATPVIIEGTNSNDLLTGTILEDQIYGFEGNDYLYGSIGNDLLDGRAGRDELEGGPDADRYVFSSQSHSPDTGPGVNGDTIIGFNGDEGDKIDLSKIDANNNSYKPGNQEFFESQLSYDSSTGVLHANVYGGSDVEIKLAGAPSLDLNVDVIW